MDKKKILKLLILKNIQIKKSNIFNNTFLNSAQIFVLADEVIVLNQEVVIQKHR